MNITHLHPSRPINGQKDSTDLQVLYRSCLSALRRYRHSKVTAPQERIRTR